MILSPAIRSVLIETASKLRGATRRRYMAETCQRLNLTHRQANIQLGWNRETLRKGARECATGIDSDKNGTPGRKPVEYHLPQLLDDIRELAEEQSEPDTIFGTARRYRWITAPEVRRQLIERKGYSEDQLPTVQTITTKLNGLGFVRLKDVVKNTLES